MYIPLTFLGSINGLIGPPGIKWSCRAGFSLPSLVHVNPCHHDVLFAAISHSHKWDKGITDNEHPILADAVLDLFPLDVFPLGVGENGEFHPVAKIDLLGLGGGLPQRHLIR